MILPDVNVLVYAHREDSDRHAEYRAWLEGVFEDPSPFGICDLVLSECLRVLTHPRVFDPPDDFSTALAFVDQIRAQENCVVIEPGPRHWSIFTQLCRTSGARGNLVADAYLAAIAIETGCDWVTTDRDFARFQNLRWRHPFDG